jgi:cellulose synthase/poly-beta-1,6-N-acetylglucosamine synthase-like glycosyltransferase
MIAALWVFWFAAAIILYTYTLYPLWLWFRASLFAQPWKRDDIRPRVSVIMAVHNGAALLDQKISQLLAIDYPKDLLEILIVSDGSNDGTDEILAKVVAGVRTFVLSERRGKAAALNVGIREANGDILVFVDIRPVLERDAVRRLVENFADRQIGCVGGELLLRSDEHDASTAAVSNLYWRYEQWMRKCEARSGSLLGVYGGFYAVRRELATQLPDGTILDDMYQPFQVARQGYRVVLDESARVWDVWPRTSNGEFARKVRTLAGNFQLLRLAPWLLRRQNPLRGRLFAHKLLRLPVPVLLVLLLITSWMLRGSPFYSILLAAQIVFYAAALLGLKFDNPITRRISGPAAAFCLLNAAATVAFWKFLFARGPLWKIWVVLPAGDRSPYEMRIGSQ